MAIGILATFAASIAYNVGVVLQALDARDEPREQGLRLSLLSSLARRRRWLAGTGITILALPLQILAYDQAPLPVVQAGLASGLVLVLFLGARYLGESVQKRDYVAVLMIIAGVAVAAGVGPTRNEPPRGGWEPVVRQGVDPSRTNGDWMSLVPKTVEVPGVLQSFNRGTSYVTLRREAFGAC